jgi:hypothetical protein
MHSLVLIASLVAAVHGFTITVTDNGAVSVVDSTGAQLASIVSAFSEPGPIWNNLSVAKPPPGSWRVRVDRSKAGSGLWFVSAAASSYSLNRTIALDPVPPARPRRLLFNDTFSTATLHHNSPPTDVIGIYTRHTVYMDSATEEEVAAALVPGTFAVSMCGTISNPGDTCRAPCLDPDAKDTNNGRPDVFVNLTRGVAVGLTALDDVFRVHAQTHQYAMRAAPRFAGRMDCAVSSPPSIELRDPHLALRAKGGDSYTAEWAAYIFEPTMPVASGSSDGSSSGGSGGGSGDSGTAACSDYYCFVNAQRRDMGTALIPMRLTGFLGPPDSAHGDTTVYNQTGYTTCFDPAVPNTPAQKAKMARTCWEHWPPETFLDFIEKQGGPGGFVHIDNEDMLYDGNCSQLSIDGNMFVDGSQRPAAFDLYFQRLVNATRAANALLPPGAPRHPLIMYTDNFLSTGINDSTLFADSIVHRADGAQQVYINCTKPGGPERTQLPMFYADGANSFSPMLERCASRHRARGAVPLLPCPPAPALALTRLPRVSDPGSYFELAFSLGADGIFHDEFPLSAFAYTYLEGGQRWDGRSVFLDRATLGVRAVVSSLVLVTQPSELKLLEIVEKHDGVMIMNGAPQTRSWVQAVLAGGLSNAPVNENENSVAWRAHHSQLYTPMMLNRYGGNLFDQDPLYNHTDCCGDDHDARRWFMTAPCLSVSEHLDFGSLSMGYGGLWHNSTAPNVYATMVPTTAVEIGEGYVVGLERTVTKRSGQYSPPLGAPQYARSSTYVYGTDCLLTAPPANGSLTVQLSLKPGQIGVVVWEAE